MTPREPSWRRYLRFWGARVDADVDDELAFHVEMRTEDYLTRGLDPVAARAKALARVGNVRHARTQCLTIGHRRQRGMTRAQFIDALRQDLRYALRTLRRNIGWTVVAVLTLGVGIGATTAVFGVVNSLILHPLPYRDADRVMLVWRVDQQSGVMMSSGSEELVKAPRDAMHFVEAIEPYQTAEATLTGTGDPATVHVAAIRSTFLPFTGIAPRLGRGFLPEESRPGGPHVAMISEEMWRSRFAGAPTVLGKTLTLNDQLYTIVGVSPSRLRIPLFQEVRTDVWLPLGVDSLRYTREAMTRVRRGVAIDAAERELDTISARLGLDAATAKYKSKLVRPRDMVGFRSSLYLLSAAVALLLAVACANVAHLLLARGATRERELAIRVALGAGRRRLARQLLTESSVLAAMGCAAGVLIGYASIHVLQVLRPPAMSQLALAEFDLRSFALAMLAAVVTGLIFGSTAALHAIRRSAHDVLRASGPSGAVVHRTHRLRSFLVVTEMAVSAMLLVGAVLVARSVAKLGRIDPGFDPAHLYTMSVTPPRNRYPSAGERAAFAQSVLRGVLAIPGVTEATLGAGIPPEAGGWMMSELDAQGTTRGEKPHFSAMNNVPPEFFSTLRIRMLSGRTFDATSYTRHEVIINQGLAKKLWPGEAAVGRRVRYGQEGDWSTVVGVASDVPSRDLAEDFDEPLVYMPLDQKAWPFRMTLGFRTRPGFDPVEPVRAVVKALDPRLVPPIVRSTDAVLSDSVSRYRFTMTLLAAFAGLSVLLSAIGLYGVIAYVVTQRQREIGIRIALGATPRDVARAIVARALVLSIVGLIAGLGMATWGAKLIRASL
ncbi:MAG TPA: ABC transporter permease, partial [Gemmatimonadaceae bacterium]